MVDMAFADNLATLCRTTALAALSSSLIIGKHAKELMNNTQIAETQQMAATADANFDHDVVALDYVLGIRQAMAVPNNDLGVKHALSHLATHLDGKESAEKFVEQIDALINTLD